ncbi:type II secretion system F family protein [Bacillus sp. EB106-08-02-XG196]|uniref:type II secretion system F family protein n=1 Tax=Bacillus sp. EB106-08-02-XG196 TaxID=2737049 RepID=UPI0015C41C48|nr:type II secretion system F family protein [Bacillus sp. EB106-08-02-XG196]NWQ39361.1 type II secretion system F family protein [Bacillus sp. EB106-08-02-XG196]
MKTAITILLLFIAVSGTIFLFLVTYAEKRRIKQRINEFLPSPEQIEVSSGREKKPSVSNQLVYKIAAMFKNVQFNEGTVKLLLEAGSKLKPEDFFALRLLVAASIGLLGLILDLPWYFNAFVVIIGFAVPKIIMKRKRKKRLAFVNYQLIEVLGMMANSMRAGFSFMQAMQLVGKEIPDPLGPEFERVIRQAGLGVPLEEVFDEMEKRLPNKELEVVIRAILAQRRSGGNLAELLETMEETIRGRVRILEELNTLTAQGRMSSWIITLLPVGLGLYLALVNREYFSPMLEHPLGWMMLFVASVSIIIGWVVIQKIIRIEV